MLSTLLDAQLHSNEQSGLSQPSRIPHSCTGSAILALAFDMVRLSQTLCVCRGQRPRNIGAYSAVILGALAGIMIVSSAACSGSEPDDPSKGLDDIGLVVAVRPNRPSFVVIRTDGTSQVYGSGVHFLPDDAVSGLTVSPTGDVLVGVDSRVYVVGAADFGSEPLQLSPSKTWTILGATNEVYASASLDGKAVWIVQTVSSPEGVDRTVADLIRIDDRARLSSATIERHLTPVGTTHGDQLILNDLDGRVIALSRSGNTVSFGSGMAISTGPNHVAVLRDEHRELAIIEFVDGEWIEHPIMPPTAGGLWRALGGSDFVPSVSTGWPTLSPAGGLLVAFKNDDDPHDWNLYMASARAGHRSALTRLRADFGLSDAAWTDNYQAVWILTPHVAQLIGLDEPETVTLTHQLEDDHFVMAAH